MVKRSTQSSRQTKRFKVTEYKKFTDMVSGSTWQLTVKQLPQNQLLSYTVLTK